MMDLEKLKELHDKAFLSGQDTREKAADDLVFARVSQWDDQLLSDSQLLYKGEFNILRKAQRQIMADLRNNEVQVDFVPIDDDRTDGADILDGLYRADDRRNQSQEAYDYASQEAVDCGFGCWELFTEYQSNRAGNEKQVIRRRYIPEASNTVFFDPNAKALDKSDARYCSVLDSYTVDGYKELVEELTGKDVSEQELNPSSFAEPEQSYSFPWFSQEKLVYVVSFYHRERVKDRVLTMIDPLGMETVLRESDLIDMMDELIDGGYSIIDEREIERWQVTRYIASGEKILDESVIAGDQIPVIPTYGERAFVEGEEVYEGITRLAKDPQRLRNFQMSYLADIVSRSPRPKPIFFPEQIQGFEYMYQITGSENNYPYQLQNRLTASGEPLPIGAVAQMPEQPIPQALAASIDLSRQAVEDVANPGVPQDIADPDISGKAVIALQNRIDQQSYTYQDNLKYAKRRDGEVYASMAVEVYAQPRKVSLVLPDGQRKTVEILQAVIDEQTGEVQYLNDITNQEFEVYADIGIAYASKKEQVIEQLTMMMQSMAPDDPMRQIIRLKLLAMIDGVDFEDVRKYATNQLILQGIKEPETPEEQQMLQQAQNQTQQPDAAMVLAQAEATKAQADMMQQQINMQKLQVDASDKDLKNQVSAFDAQTKRIAVQVNAQETGATIENKQADTLNKTVDAQIKAQQAREADIQNMSTEELLRLARG